MCPPHPSLGPHFLKVPVRTLSWSHCHLQAFVVFVTMCREAYDDFVRFRRDKEVNSQLYKKLTKKGATKFDIHSIAQVLFFKFWFLEICCYILVTLCGETFVSCYSLWTGSLVAGACKKKNWRLSKVSWALPAERMQARLCLLHSHVCACFACNFNFWKFRWRACSQEKNT